MKAFVFDFAIENQRQSFARHQPEILSLSESACPTIADDFHHAPGHIEFVRLPVGNRIDT